MKEDSIKCAVRIQNQKTSNNQILDKKEAGPDKRKHQTPVLSPISCFATNGGRPKGFTLKTRTPPKREWMKRSSISLVCFWRKI